MIQIGSATRTNLCTAVLAYLATEWGDEASPHYDAQLELDLEVLNRAAKAYVRELEGSWKPLN